MIFLLTSKNQWKLLVLVCNVRVRAVAPRRLRSIKDSWSLTNLAISLRDFAMVQALGFSGALVGCILVFSISTSQAKPNPYYSLYRPSVDFKPYYGLTQPILSNTLEVPFYIEGIFTFIVTSRHYFWNLGWCFFAPWKFFQILPGSFYTVKTQNLEESKRIFKGPESILQGFFLKWM